MERQISGRRGPVYSSRMVNRVAPSTTLAPTTTEAAVGAATSTTGGGELPFTGATAGPMLIAGIALVGGGALFLLLSRERRATR